MNFAQKTMFILWTAIGIFAYASHDPYWTAAAGAVFGMICTKATD